MESENSNFMKKVARKLKRFQHILEKETGILTCSTPTKIIAICNIGLANGLTEENVVKAFSPFGGIEKIILLPGKSCSFVCYNEISSAENAYATINGKLNLAQDNKPLYLLYSETVPETEISKSSHPPGLILINDFVSDEEESVLLSCIKWDNQDSSNLKHRKVKHYGYEFRYDINNVDKNSPLSSGIPEKCINILERFCANNEQFKDFEADQLTINEYQPGQGIPSHVDTHSAFEDPILSLSLGSAVNMEFRRNDGTHFSILLPRKSLLVMSGESRYAWSHGITPRKLDVIPTENGLTTLERGVRTSFTFRKVRKNECNCKYYEQCDSYVKQKVEIERNLAEELESTHVHKVYEEIASHFSDTRHKPWPNVLDFINSFSPGSILIDVGCGNGKYLGHNKDIFKVGCDRSINLIDICHSRGFQAFNCNCLHVPLKTNSADGVISIAVIHHLANEERRLHAIKEIVRILRVGGQALIYVWAKNQQKHKKSSYLKQDRKNRKEDNSTEVQPNEVVNVGNDTVLPVHVNRTQFQHQDVLVPWKLKQKNTEDDDQTNSDSNLFLRYYHVFEEGELEAVCNKIPNLKIIKSYYDQGNWCVILEKL